MTTLNALLCVTTVLIVTMASSANQLFTLNLTCINSYVPADSVFGDVSGVRSRADCARLCQSRDACSAFDVGEAGGECRFHQLTLAQKQCSALIRQGKTLYYEMSHSCVNSGQYDRQAGECQCPVNYFGEFCEIDNPCQNGGTYNKGPGTCTCLANYVGTLCDTYNPCQNGAYSNGHCVCDTFWHGTVCNMYCIGSIVSDTTGLWCVLQ